MRRLRSFLVLLLAWKLLSVDLGLFGYLRWLWATFFLRFNWKPQVILNILSCITQLLRCFLRTYFLLMVLRVWIDIFHYYVIFSGIIINFRLSSRLALSWVYHSFLIFFTDSFAFVWFLLTLFMFLELLLYLWPGWSISWLNFHWQITYYSIFTCFFNSY